MPLDLVAIAVSLVGAVLVGIVLGALHMAIRIRFRHQHSADPEFEPCEPDYLAPEASRMVGDLSDLGFVFLGHWQHTGHSHATGEVTLMEHPQTLDLARVVVVMTATRQQVVLIFQTRFADGTEVATANQQVAAGLPTPPEITGLWMPEVRDAVRLYHLHAQLRDSRGAGKKRLAIGPDPTAFLRATALRVNRHHVETGYTFLDEPHGVYRPTLKAALLMTWRLSWPVRPLYRAWRRRRMRMLLDELGIDPES
jgi:hypothetical protein